MVMPEESLALWKKLRRL